MPKSRKRKGAGKYKPKFDLKRKMDPVETLKALNAKSLVLGASMRDALNSDDTERLKDRLARVTEASEEAHDFARQPLRRMVGPSENKARD